MPIYKSSEFKGFGFNYDPSAQPFFKALVKENLRLLATLPTGKRLLSAIKDARPAYRPRSWPSGVNVVLQPPLGRNWSTPGLGATSGKITDQARFDAFNEARDPGNFMLDNDFGRRKAGKLIPGITAKTQVQEEDKNAASDGTGSACTLFYSNTEILSDTGTWFIPHITMGHELIHCMHGLQGQMNKDNRIEEYTTVGMKGYAGAITENMLRAEAKYPKRTKYFADD